jgi:hypothetical protein
MQRFHRRRIRAHGTVNDGGYDEEVNAVVVMECPYRAWLRYATLHYTTLLRGASEVLGPCSATGHSLDMEDSQNAGVNLVVAVNEN